MPLLIRKREGESVSSVLFRFSKRMKQSGVLKEVKKRRFYKREVNKRQIRLSAIHKDNRKKELERQKKLGIS